MCSVFHTESNIIHMCSDCFVCRVFCFGGVTYPSHKTLTKHVRDIMQRDPVVCCRLLDVVCCRVLYG